MHQSSVWEKEYKNLSLVTGSTEPQNDFKRFLKWLKKTRKTSFEGLRVLDLGSGVGKNSIFLAERGARVVGMEISTEAIKVARKRAGNLNIEFLHADIGSNYPFADKFFDLVIDAISSNSLDNRGREVYLKEVFRVLKPQGYFFVRALCKDGDKNAENLLNKYPGKERDTYVMPDLGLTERVFSKEDFTQMYSKYFKILQVSEKLGYATFKGTVYKRKYLLAYLQKL